MPSLIERDGEQTDAILRLRSGVAVCGCVIPPERTSLSAALTSSGDGLSGLRSNWKPVLALAAFDATDIFV